MSAALDTLTGFGFDEATLWVLDRNDRARQFYEAGGWHADGATKVEDGPGFPIAEVRYRRSDLRVAAEPDPPPATSHP